jgi:hypothetical protein
MRLDGKASTDEIRQALGMSRVFARTGFFFTVNASSPARGCSKNQQE